MRDYAIVSPYFWLGSTGKMVRGRKNAQVLAFYLLTCPSSNMLGMYYLPIPTMVHETGLTEDEVMAALDLLSTPDLPVDNLYIETPSKPHPSPSEAPPKGLPRISHAPSMPHRSPLEGAYGKVFSLYDPISEYVFIPKMATFQVGESLKTGDKRIAGIEKELKRLQKCPFYHLFMKLYARKYHLSTETVDNFEVKAPSMPLARAFDAPSMPHRSQDQDQDQDQEQEQEKSPLPPFLKNGGSRMGGGVWITWLRQRKIRIRKMPEPLPPIAFCGYSII